MPAREINGRKILTSPLKRMAVGRQTLEILAEKPEYFLHRPDFRLRFIQERAQVEDEHNKSNWKAI